MELIIPIMTGLIMASPAIVGIYFGYREYKNDSKVSLEQEIAKLEAGTPPHHVWLLNLHDELDKMKLDHHGNIIKNTLAGVRVQPGPAPGVGYRHLDPVDRRITQVYNNLEEQRNQLQNAIEKSDAAVQKAISAQEAAAKPVYLYKDYQWDYTEVEVDQLLDAAIIHKRQVGIGAPTAVRFKVDHDVASDKIIEFYKCVNHPDYKMWMNDETSDQFKSATFQCPKCEAGEQRVFKGVFMNE